MGWTGFKTKESLMDSFRNEYSAWLVPGGENEILKSIEVPIKGIAKDEGNEEESEIFSAIRHRVNGKSYIYAHVLLINRADGQVMYKGMDEFSGPYTKSKCPKEIFSILTPIKEIETINEYVGYSKEWRTRQ